MIAPSTFYERHGWFISDLILPDRLLDDAMEGALRQVAGEQERDLPYAVPSRHDWKPGDERPLRINDHIVYRNSRIASLAMCSEIGKLAAELTGANEIRLLDSELIWKDPGSQRQDARVGWHCDRAHFRTCSSDRMLTAWIPLQDVDESLGTLLVLDGSHRWPDEGVVSQLRRRRTMAGDDHDHLWTCLEQTGRDLRIVPINIRRGQVSFHSFDTFHGSGFNVSETARIAVVLHLQDGENEYSPSYDFNGMLEETNYSRLMRKRLDGTPDYADPDACPVLWRQLS